MQTIREIMTKDVDVLNPNADLVEVAQHMKKQDVGILPVSDGKRVQGIVTKSDVVIRALARNKDPRATRASDVMTRDVDYCFADQSIEDAVEIMKNKEVSHLLVLDRNKNLVGIVSLDDLTNWVGRKQLLGRIEESFTPGIRLRAGWRGFRVGTRTGIGIVSAAVLALGYFAIRRGIGGIGMQEEGEGMRPKDIRAA